MTGSSQISRGMYYAVINLVDEDGKRKQKWVALHIKGVPGNKKKADSACREILGSVDTKVDR